MVDPKLRGRYPARGLFQALAVAAMCLHEQAASRPLIADVVTALNFLASQANDIALSTPNRTSSATVSSARPSEDAATATAAAASAVAAEIAAGGSQQAPDDDAGDGGGAQSGADNAGWKAPARGKERDQAVAEARTWGEAWREKRIPT